MNAIASANVSTFWKDTNNDSDNHLQPAPALFSNSILYPQFGVVLHCTNFKPNRKTFPKLHYLSIYSTLHTILTTAFCLCARTVHAYKTSDTTVYKIIFAKNNTKKKFISDVRRGDKFLLNEFFIAPSRRETFSGIGKWNVYPSINAILYIRIGQISTEYRRQNFYCFTIIDLDIDLNVVLRCLCRWWIFNTLVGESIISTWFLKKISGKLSSS